MTSDELGLLQGTLDLLIVVEDRALYLALHRLDGRGFVVSEWGASENNRRARYYAITPAGRQQLRARVSHWTRYAAAVAKIVNADEPLPTSP
jgi:DNA-binding PadR family transcriptional regulator